MATKTKKKVRGSVAIYGTDRVGHGFIASVEGGQTFGDGDPREGYTATDTLFQGLRKLRANGVDGDIAVHIDVDGEPLVAMVRPGAFPMFGDLKFTTGEMLSVSAEAIMQAATDQQIERIQRDVNAAQ